MDEEDSEIVKKGGYGTKLGPFHSGWANLAARIISEGEKYNDTFFLQSEWCKFLKDLCACDAEIYDKSNVQEISYERKTFC